jgi:hypothetical protein
MGRKGTKQVRANRYDLSDPSILKLWKTLNYKGNKALAAFWSKANNEMLGKEDQELGLEPIGKEAWERFVCNVLPNEKGKTPTKELKLMACVISKRSHTEPVMVSAAQVKKFMWDTQLSTYKSTLERPGLKFVKRYDDLLKSASQGQDSGDEDSELEAAMRQEQQEEAEAEQERQIIASMECAEKERERREDLLRFIGEINPLLRKLCAADQLPDRRCRHCSYSEDPCNDPEAEEFNAQLLGELDSGGYPHTVISPVQVNTRSRLVEAVSLSIWGSEIMAGVLQQALRAELETNRRWYEKQGLPKTELQDVVESLQDDDVDGTIQLEEDESEDPLLRRSPKREPLEQFVLRVTVLNARNLKAVDGVGVFSKKDASSDPYVKLWLDAEDKQQTSVKLKNLSPCWNESFVTGVKNAVNGVVEPLWLEVRDYDEGSKDDFMGSVGPIGLRKLKFGEIKKAWYPLKTKAGKEGCGEIELEISLASRSSVSLCSVYAMANVLQRPIVVSCPQNVVDESGLGYFGCGGCFAPTRHKDYYKHPLVLAWNSEKQDYFVVIAELAPQLFGAEQPLPMRCTYSVPALSPGIASAAARAGQDKSASKEDNDALAIATIQVHDPPTHPPTHPH